MEEMTDQEFLAYEQDQIKTLDQERAKLNQERARRGKERLEKQKVKNAGTIQLVKDNPAILSFLKHDCSSCSDKNPSNGYSDDRGYAKCAKCHLMEVLDNEDDRFEISISVNINLSQPRL